METKKIDLGKMDVKHMSANSLKGFAMLAGINRDIKPFHVTRMAKSVEAKSCIRPIVVSVLDFLGEKDRKYIIDGQHLYHALLRLGCSIPYVEIYIEDEEDLAETLANLNNSSRSWTMRDYLQVWAHIEEDYRKLRHYFNVYDIELAQLAELLMDGTCSPHIGGGTVSPILKRGEFRIEDEIKAIKLLDYVTEALKIIPRLDRVSNKMFISSYVSYVNSVVGYDHAKFLKNLKTHKDKFKLATIDPEEYRKLIKSINK